MFESLAAKLSQTKNKQTKEKRKRGVKLGKEISTKAKKRKKVCKISSTKVKKFKNYHFVRLVTVF